MMWTGSPMINGGPMGGRRRARGVVSASATIICVWLVIAAGCSTGSAKLPTRAANAAESPVIPLPKEPRGRRVPIAMTASNPSAVPIIQGVNLGETIVSYCRQAFSQSPNYRVLAMNAPGGVEVVLKVSVTEVEREVTFDQVSGRWILVIAGGKHDYSEKIGVVQVFGELVAPATGEVIAAVSGEGRLEEIETTHEGGFSGQRGGVRSRSKRPLASASQEAVFEMARNIDQAMVDRGAWRVPVAASGVP